MELNLHFFSMFGSNFSECYITTDNDVELQNSNLKFGVIISYRWSNFVQKQLQ